MLFPLQFVDPHGVYRLFEVAKQFFELSVDARRYERTLFPPWVHPVLDRSRSLNQLFDNLFLEISRLPHEKRENLFTAFQTNNQIQKLCEDKTFLPVRMEEFSVEIRSQIGELFETMYNKTTTLKSFETCSGGSMFGHYAEFRKLNQIAVCPFCGLVEYPAAGCGTRACYDHYLSIGHYPLSGVNFRNLVPMCKDCNEPPAKGQKDLLYSDGAMPQRRQVFYPYGGSGGVEIKVTCLLKPSLNDLGEWEVNITPMDPNEAEQIQTWCEVFNIKRRYEAYVAEHQRWWISLFVHSENLSGQELDVPTLKQNMTKWKESHRFIKIQTGALLCSAFFNYLINEAELTYLEGLCKLIEENEIKVPL